VETAAAAERWIAAVEAAKDTATRNRGADDVLETTTTRRAETAT
jgi:hypothetical protein